MATRHIRSWLVSLAVASCSHGTVPSDANDGLDPPPGGTAEFTVSPVDLSQIAILTPLGNLAPPGHVLPTDHVYFYQNDFDQFPLVPATAVLPVVAPAAGKLSFMLRQPSGDYKIQSAATREFGWYLDHIQPRASLAVGSIVRAGDTLGTTNPGGAIDLGAWDRRVTLPGLANPLRYHETALHAVSPWKYFVEPLKRQIYARIRRHPDIADKDGRIDFGIAGRLVGDWYDETVPNSIESQGPAGWPKTVAFVYDYYDPRLVRISIGGTIAAPGVWTIPPVAPRPANVSASSGRVAYRLMYTGSTTVQYGLMLVEMTAPDRIRIEVFPGSQSGDGEFTASARTYLR